jgi:hypothetical protein
VRAPGSENRSPRQAGVGSQRVPDFFKVVDRPEHRVLPARPTANVHLHNLVAYPRLDNDFDSHGAAPWRFAVDTAATRHPASAASSALVNAGRSSGVRLVMTCPSTTTSRSTNVAPAFSMSSRIE